MFMAPLYYELPVDQVARDMNLVVAETMLDGENASVLIEDVNSGVKFWVDLGDDGSWDFNQYIFSLYDSRDCFLLEFFRHEDVVRGVDDLVCLVEVQE